MCLSRKQLDINSSSNYQDVVTNHTDVDLSIDFERSILTGSTTINLETTAIEGLNEFILDTSFLNIFRISMTDAELQWELKPHTEPNGSPLHIKLDRLYQKGEKFTVQVSHIFPFQNMLVYVGLNIELMFAVSDFF